MNKIDKLRENIYLSMNIPRHFLEWDVDPICKKRSKSFIKWYNNTFIKPFDKVKRKLKRAYKL